jgi:prefoldin subunit 5
MVIRTIGGRFRQCAFICALGLLSNHNAPAQRSVVPAGAATKDRQSPESSVITEYSKFLQDEDKAHRDYLEKLYTTTSGILAFLVAVGVGVVGYAQFKTRKDVEEAVKVRFDATVDLEIRRRIERLTARLKQFDQTLANLRDEAEDTKKTLQDLRSLATDTRSLAEKKPPEPPEDETSRQAVSKDGETLEAPASSLSKDETEILKAIGNSRYSLRTQTGVIQEAAKQGVGADSVIRSMDVLTQRGYIGKTLGKTGGERWYVTEAGRRVLLGS